MKTKLHLVTPVPRAFRGEKELWTIAQIMRAVLPPEVGYKLMPSDANLFAIQFASSVLPRLMRNEDEQESLFWWEIVGVFTRMAAYGPNGPQG